MKSVSSHFSANLPCSLDTKQTMILRKCIWSWSLFGLIGDAAEYSFDYVVNIIHVAPQ
jgi:hypothetical protein